jgi:hypothetical protein
MLDERVEIPACREPTTGVFVIVAYIDAMLIGLVVLAVTAAVRKEVPSNDDVFSTVVQRIVPARGDSSTCFIVPVIDVPKSFGDL